MDILHLDGWLCYDEDGLLSLKTNQETPDWNAKSIQFSIGDFF